MSQYTTPNLTVTAANGVTYAYRRYGKAGTTPVLFLHHFRGNLDNWDPALVDDIAAEHEVILFDTAVSPAPTDRPRSTFAQAGRDALAFVDALGLTEIDVFGFSIGGFVAQEITLQRPGLVRRLVLAATGPQGGNEMERWAPTTHFHAMKDVQDAGDILALFFAPPTPAARRAWSSSAGSSPAPRTATRPSRSRHGTRRSPRSRTGAYRMPRCSTASS